VPRNTQLPDRRVLSGRSSRTAAASFSYGTIAAVLLPIPLGILWTGAAILVYAMNRHHPYERVGEYTQRAAYRFYGVAGGFIAVASFFPGSGVGFFLVVWALAAAALISLSVRDLVQIYRSDWPDLDISESI